MLINSSNFLKKKISNNEKRWEKYSENQITVLYFHHLFKNEKSAKCVCVM